MKIDTLLTLSFAILLGGLSTSTNAAPVPDAVSTTDSQIIDAMASQLFSQLKSGHTADAVNGFLGRSKLMNGKAQDLAYLASQVDGTIRIYGAIENCSLYSEESRAGLVQVRYYICQHQDFLTRWQLIFGKSGSGWIPLNLRFDDKVANDLTS